MLARMTNTIELEMSTWATVVDARVQAIEQRWQVFSALVVLNILDVFTTGFVLEQGGSERNPFIEPMIDSLAQVTLLKLVILGLVATLLMRTRQSRIADLALTAATGWYVAVVIWNLAVLTLL